MTANPVAVFAAVEGPVDEAVARSVIAHCGGVMGPVFGKNGKTGLRNRIRGYSHAARLNPWLVIVDLNHEAACPPALVSDWLPEPAGRMCFRVAVREIEAWLMADVEGIADFLKISPDLVPPQPELLDDPKEEMVNLARRSRSRDIRLDMVPRPGSGRKVGPAYPGRLIEFVESYPRRWRPDAASARSESLRRCLKAVQEMIRG